MKKLLGIVVLGFYRILYLGLYLEGDKTMFSSE